MGQTQNPLVLNLLKPSFLAFLGFLGTDRLGPRGDRDWLSWNSRANLAQQSIRQMTHHLSHFGHANLAWPSYGGLC